VNKRLLRRYYLPLQAPLNGVIRPIWPRMDNGNITLWVTLIEESDLLKLIEK
jgi:hypothetical protein